MKSLHKGKLKEIAEVRNQTCASIYIPTHKTGREVKNGEDSLRFKTHLQKVRNALKEQGFSDDKARAFVSKATALNEDSNFWRHQTEGLAVFISEDYFEYFHLPITVDEFCMVSQSFHLKRLLPLFSEDNEYYVLALSLGKSKFYRANRYTLMPIDLEDDVPTSLEESLKYTEFEKSLQHQSGAGGSNSAIFHGQAKGINGDERDQFILEYFRKLDKGVTNIINGEHLPLLLVGLEYTLPMYRQANNYNHLHDKGIDLNPADLDEKQLHQKTQEFMEPLFSQKRKDFKEKYEGMAGTGKTSYDIKNIIPEAVNGRVEAVFVKKGAHCWGTYAENGADLKVDTHEEFQLNDDCLISMSAVMTVLNGGQAYLLEDDEMPEKNVDADIIAVYRY